MDKESKEWNPTKFIDDLISDSYFREMFSFEDFRAVLIYMKDNERLKSSVDLTHLVSKMAQVMLKYVSK